jgi:hypothetical protein
LQKTYEEDLLLQDKKNPLVIVKEIANTIKSYSDYDRNIEMYDKFFPKRDIPLSQLMAMYGLLKLIYFNKNLTLKT